MSRGGTQFKRGGNLPYFLRCYRFLRNMDMSDIAKDIGISKSTYHELETGKRVFISGKSRGKIIKWLFDMRR